MTDETTVVTTEAAPAAVVTTESTTVDQTKESTPVNTDTPAPDAAETEKPDGKKPNRVSERIKQLTSEKYQLREEKQRLEDELNTLRQQNAPREPVKPKLADFGSDAEYESAMDQFYQKKASYDSAQTSQRETEQQTAQRKQGEIAKSTQKFVSDLSGQKANYEDIDNVMADPSFVAITKHMSSDLINLIQISDKNVALAYHLGTHLDEAEEIASLPLARAAHKLALLESRLELPKPKTVSNAPDPIKPVQAKSTKEVDISDPNISDAEFNAARRKQKAARSGRG